MTMTMLGPIFLVMGAPATLALRALKPARRQRAGTARVAGLAPAQLDHAAAHQPVLRLLRLRHRPLRPVHDAAVRLPHGQPRRARGHAAALPRRPATCSTGSSSASTRGRKPLPYWGRLLLLLLAMSVHGVLRGDPDDGHARPMAVEWYGIVRPPWVTDPLQRHPRRRPGRLGPHGDPQPHRPPRHRRAVVAQRRPRGHAARPAGRPRRRRRARAHTTSNWPPWPSGTAAPGPTRSPVVDPPDTLGGMRTPASPPSVIAALADRRLGLSGCSSAPAAVPRRRRCHRTSAAVPAPDAPERVDDEAFLAVIESPGSTLIDVRTPQEFADGHIEGAVNYNVRVADFANADRHSRPGQDLRGLLPQRQPVAGRRSRDAEGRHPAHLRAGERHQGWVDAAYPVVYLDPPSLLSGQLLRQARAFGATTDHSTQ